MGLSYIEIFVVGSENACTYFEAECEIAVQGHPMSNVIDFGTNGKRTCNVLLVINSNLGHV